MFLASMAGHYAVIIGIWGIFLVLFWSVFSTGKITVYFEVGRMFLRNVYRTECVSIQNVFLYELDGFY